MEEPEIIAVHNNANGAHATAATAPKPTSLQQRMLALSGQNIDDFMKEMEEVHRKRERDRAADLNARYVLFIQDIVKKLIRIVRLVK